MNAVHLAYAILGGYVCVFSLVSLFIKEKLYIGEASKISPSHVTSQITTTNSSFSRRYNSGDYFWTSCAQLVRSIHMGKHRPNHPRTLTHRPYSTSLCRRSRITKSLHVATLEKFILVTRPCNDIWLDSQFSIHILAHPSFKLCTTPSFLRTLVN